MLVLEWKIFCEEFGYRNFILILAVTRIVNFILLKGLIQYEKITGLKVLMKNSGHLYITHSYPISSIWRENCKCLHQTVVHSNVHCITINHTDCSNVHCITINHTDCLKMYKQGKTKQFMAILNYTGRINFYIFFNGIKCGPNPDIVLYSVNNKFLFCPYNSVSSNLFMWKSVSASWLSQIFFDTKWLI